MPGSFVELVVTHTGVLLGNSGRLCTQWCLLYCSFLNLLSCLWKSDKKFHWVLADQTLVVLCV